MTRIAICDDHQLVRTAIARVLASRVDLQVAYEAGTTSELWRRLEIGEIPDLLLLDLDTDAGGVASGLSTLERLIRVHPRLRVLVVSMHGEPESVERALRGGASGFVAKGSSMETLLQAVDTIRRGRRYVDPVLVDDLILRRDAASGSWDERLTPREREVMTRLCAGERLSQVAAALGLSIKTVSTHKTRLMIKLGVNNNAELIRLGEQHGLR